MRWLQLISERRLTITGAPDFAYALCADAATSTDLETLDLSSWSLALNGSEPVRPETFERFARVFEPCGFCAEAFYPGYGLAEATLMVSGGTARSVPPVCSFSVESIDNGRPIPQTTLDPTIATKESATAAPTGLLHSGSSRTGSFRTLVGGGRARGDLELLIVDPDSHQSVLEGRIGEIWLAGGSVAQGYWNRPELTAETFAAFTAKPRRGPYLRTGDLGFLHRDELFITGRRKDLIILRGRNLYPQDIEWLAHQTDPALPAGRGAAFTIEVLGQDELVLVHEVDRAYRDRLEPTQLLDGINQELTTQYAVRLYALFLLRPGAIPRTPNGKIQRQACRQRLLADDLKVLAFKVQGTDSYKHQPAGRRPPQGEMEALVAGVWKQVLGVSEISATENFFDLGGDSTTAVQVQQRLESALGRSLPVVDLFRLATIEALAANLRETPRTASFEDTSQRVADRRRALGHLARRRRMGR